MPNRVRARLRDLSIPASASSRSRTHVRASTKAYAGIYTLGVLGADKGGGVFCAGVDIRAAGGRACFHRTLRIHYIPKQDAHSGLSPKPSNLNPSSHTAVYGQVQTRKLPKGMSKSLCTQLLGSRLNPKAAYRPV